MPWPQDPHMWPTSSTNTQRETCVLWEWLSWGSQWGTWTGSSFSLVVPLICRFTEQMRNSFPTLPTTAHCVVCLPVPLRKHKVILGLRIKLMLPWLVWLSGLSAGLRTKRSLLRFPVRAHAWVVSWVPSRGHLRDNHRLMFLSLSFSLPSFLSKNK